MDYVELENEDYIKYYEDLELQKQKDAELFAAEE